MLDKLSWETKGCDHDTYKIDNYCQRKCYLFPPFATLELELEPPQLCSLRGPVGAADSVWLLSLHNAPGVLTIAKSTPHNLHSQGPAASPFSPLPLSSRSRVQQETLIGSYCWPL